MRTIHALAASLLMFTACASDDQLDDELEIGGEAQAADKADHATVSFSELEANVSDNRLGRGGTYLITSRQSWFRAMGTAAPASIDFSRNWVAFYGTGTKNTGGHGAEITGVEYSASLRSLILSTKATSPGNDCLVTQAFTTPHMLVTFRIPSPRPLAAYSDNESVVERCGPDNSERLEQLATSKETWNLAKGAASNSYTYSREFASFTGFTGRTTLVVANGVVTERHYKAQHVAGGPTTQWSETGAQVGSHQDEGFPAVTIDALYEECRTQVLTQNENDNWMQFSTDERGFLQACTYTPMSCQDDCSRGPTISSIAI